MPESCAPVLLLNQNESPALAGQFHVHRDSRSLEAAQEDHRTLCPGSTMHFSPQRSFGHGEDNLSQLAGWHKIFPALQNRGRMSPVVVKVDAPLHGTLKTLLQRMLLACGATYAKGDSEENLLLKLEFYRRQYNIKLIIVDDAEHIPYSTMRNYLRHISSVVRDIPIICASTNPASWAAGYQEILSSWNDYVTLSMYNGERLRELLAFIEMLLPFTQESGLFIAELNAGTEMTDDPVKLIEKWTGGILRDVVMLLVHASRRAIEDDRPGLSLQLLEEAWKEIQTERVETFF